MRFARKPRSDAAAFGIHSDVQIDLGTLPDDPAILQQIPHDVVAAEEHQYGTLQAESDKLRLLIQRLLRQRFGRRSEQLSPDHLQLGPEDLQQRQAEQLSDAGRVGPLGYGSSSTVP